MGSDQLSLRRKRKGGSGDEGKESWGERAGPRRRALRIVMNARLEKSRGFICIPEFKRRYSFTLDNQRALSSLDVAYCCSNHTFRVELLQAMNAR